MPAISAPRKLKQEDFWEFEVILGYIVSTGSAWATQQYPVSDKNEC